MLAQWKKGQLEELIFTGKVSIISPESSSLSFGSFEAIELLKQAAQEDFQYLLDCIITAYDENMTIPAMAAFVANCDIKVPKINRSLLDLLSTWQAKSLLLLVEFLKSKVFGGGLGSKAQKLIRRVLENWTIDVVQTYIILQPKEIYALVKLIHPRWNGERGKAIKKLLI